MLASYQVITSHCQRKILTRRSSSSACQVEACKACRSGYRNFEKGGVEDLWQRRPHHVWGQRGRKFWKLDPLVWLKTHLCSVTLNYLSLQKLVNILIKLSKFLWKAIKNTTGIFKNKWSIFILKTFKLRRALQQHSSWIIRNRRTSIWVLKTRNKAA